MHAERKPGKKQKTFRGATTSLAQTFLGARHALRNA